MTLRERLALAAEELERAGIEDPMTELEWVVSDHLGVSRPAVLLRLSESVSPALGDLIGSFLTFRRSRQPLQHWLGRAPFLDWELEVNSEVLIPRPETEVLALRAEAILGASGVPRPRVLDIGTGSGCLALHVALRFPDADVEAWDLSGAALSVAARNARRLGATRLRLVHQDLFQAGPDRVSGLDLIVSNPPYIPATEVGTLAPEVKDNEPRLALDGGEDGLRFYRRLADMAGHWLKPGGFLVLEHGDGQSAAIAEMFRPSRFDVEAEKDLSGRDRVLIVRRPTAPGS